MGGKGKGSYSSKGKGNGKGSGQQQGESAYIKRVDLHKFLSKWMLRSYPDPRGYPLFTEGKQGASHLSASNVDRMLDSDCSEFKRRLGMAVNLSSACIDGATLFHDVLEDRHNAFKNLLMDDNFSEAVKYFNLAREQNRGSELTKNQFKSLLEWLSEDVEAKMSTAAAAAEVYASQYLGATAFMEMLAVLSQDLKLLAKAMAEPKKQPKEMQAWMKNPKDKKLLAKYFAAHVKAEEKKNKDKPRIWGQFESDAEDESEGSASSKSSSSSSGSSSNANRKKKSASKKEKKNKKAKKNKKEKTSSSSASSSGDKKDKEDKKKRSWAKLAEASDSKKRKKDTKKDAKEKETRTDDEKVADASDSKKQKKDTKKDVKEKETRTDDEKEDAVPPLETAPEEADIPAAADED